MYDPVETSTARPNEGITTPDNTHQLKFGRGGDEISRGVRWDGAEYGEDCWIRADLEDFEPVEP